MGRRRSSRVSVRKLRRALLNRTPPRLQRILFSGRAKHCPICQTDLRAFRGTATGRRSSAACPVCGSRERHRLTWMVLAEHTDLLSPPRKRVLHFAPERSIAGRLGALSHLHHVTADLAPTADLRIDITAIPLADGSVDAVLCSHVLEHVEDDHRALREMLRILRPGGWALIQIPTAPWMDTFEDPSVTDQAERLRVFGQGHHVRVYGRDVADRFEQAGFDVAVVTAQDIATAKRLASIGVGANETAYRCDKPVR